LTLTDSGAWKQVVFSDDPAFVESKACEFSMTMSGGRPCLLIGPWRAGDWSARWQWKAPLVPLEGTIRGRYRTEGVLPFTCEVSYAYMRGSDRLRREGVSLEPAESWTAFEVAARRPPPGAEGVAPAFGLAAHTAGRVWFADLVFSAGVAAVRFPAHPPLLARKLPRRDFARAPRFRVERDGDTWWFVTPGGRLFYSAGTDVPGFKDEAEGEKLAATVRGAGFNSLGGWSNVWRWGKLNDRHMAAGEPTFAAFHAVETSGLAGCGRLADPGEKGPPGDHSFPDPFDPAFGSAYRTLVADAAGEAAGKPWFAGWFIDNERDHERLDRRVWSGHAGEAFRRRLEDRYRAVAGLNTAWGTSFASFDAVARAKPVALAREGTLYGDCLAFSREIVRRYVDSAVAAIREADPGGLVLTNRFMMGGIADTLLYLDLYAACDVVAVNLYPANRSPGLSGDELAILGEIHRRTGKPILIGEWSVPALDSGLYDNPAKLDWSWPEAVETQADRAGQAALVTAGFYNVPYVIGAHWFTWRDFDSPKRRANRGLIRASGEPWRALLDSFAAIHARMGLTR